jgi:hypothetical protein
MLSRRWLICVSVDKSRSRTTASVVDLAVHPPSRKLHPANGRKSRKTIPFGTLCAQASDTVDPIHIIKNAVQTSAYIMRRR